MSAKHSAVEEYAQAFWACAESYRGSGRPSRLWVQETTGERPDAEDENGNVAYPFNGMGGEVIDGPFPTEYAAELELSRRIWMDDDGMLQWETNIPAARR